MSHDYAQDLLARYARDRSPAAFAELVEVCSPLIRSVCRRYLHEPADVEDAQQAVLIKLARHAERIEGSLTAWLSLTTRSACVDLIRRSARQRRVVDEASQLQHREHESLLRWEAAMRQLSDALALVDHTTRELLIDRYLRDQPLRAIAAQRDISAATAHRHVKSALDALGQAYHDLGFREIDDLPLEALLDHGNMLSDPHHTAHGLRFAADWRAVAEGFEPGLAHPASALAPGWDRPIRVGVLVSHTCATYRAWTGWVMNADEQVIWTRLLLDPRYELVTVIESNTSDQPVIERMMREHRLTGGLIDAMDVEAMRTLDVLYFGRQLKIAPRVAGAIQEAVRSGVGLYRHGQLEQIRDGHDAEPRRELTLAGQILGCHCTAELERDSPHHLPMPATVRATHPALPGLEPGDTMLIDGCFALFHMDERVQMPITYDRLYTANTIGATWYQPPPQMRPQPAPVVMTGNIGAGRALVVNPIWVGPLIEHPKLQGNFLQNIIHWLAEPRRTAGGGRGRQHEAKCR